MSVFRKKSYTRVKFQVQVMSRPGRKDLGPRDHFMSLAALCGICGRKGPGLSNITATIQDRIRTFTPLKNFSLDTGFYPTKVCASCRLTLSEFNKVSKSEKFLSTDFVISFKKFAFSINPVIFTSYHD